MSSERLASQGKDIVKVIDWGDKTNYLVEIHCLRNPADSFMQSVKRKLGDTFEFSVTDSGLSRSQAQLMAKDLVSRMRPLMQVEGYEYRVEVKPENLNSLLQG